MYHSVNHLGLITSVRRNPDLVPEWKRSRTESRTEHNKETEDRKKLSQGVGRFGWPGPLKTTQIHFQYKPTHVVYSDKTPNPNHIHRGERVESNKFSFYLDAFLNGEKSIKERRFLFANVVRFQFGVMYDGLTRLILMQK